jgi:uncharacterized RDD family membrane protein YckC/predicted RNA-binding Zn-ribbon protein involved in translation (DUF1610 family)
MATEIVDFEDEPVQRSPRRERPCPLCGELIAVRLQVCPHCGEQLVQKPRDLDLTDRDTYASLAERTIAGWCDVFILMGCMFAAYIVLSIGVAVLLFTRVVRPEDVRGSADFHMTIGFVAIGLEAFVVWAYDSLFAAMPWSASPGKLLTSSRVLKVDGQRVGFWRSQLRSLARAICFFLPGAYLCLLFTAKKQALHDLVAGTVVVRKW